MGRHALAGTSSARGRGQTWPCPEKQRLSLCRKTRRRWRSGKTGQTCLQRPQNSAHVPDQAVIVCLIPDRACQVCCDGRARSPASTLTSHCFVPKLWRLQKQQQKKEMLKEAPFPPRPFLSSALLSLVGNPTGHRAATGAGRASQA